MLNNINQHRFNLALITGRQFYCTCLLLLKHVENLEVQNASSLINVGDYSIDLRLSANRDHTFNSLGDYAEISDDNNSACIELFNLFDSTMYVNIWKELNFNQFKRRYQKDYSKSILPTIYAASKTIVPIEINLCSSSIKCIYGEKSILSGSRYPLVDLLYRSDEMMKFVNLFIPIIMMSSFLYQDLIAFHCSEKGSYIRSYADNYETWSSKLFNLKKCFSELLRS